MFELGDYNPLHIDPDASAMMGFDVPILHGLASLGFTARAVLTTFANNDPTKFKSIRVRFAKPVLPGETLVVKMWKTSGEGSEVKIVCEVRVKERDIVVVNNCYVVLQNLDSEEQLQSKM